MDRLDSMESRDGILEEDFGHGTVIDGYLFKKSDYRQAWRPRYFVLSAYPLRSLQYFKSPNYRCRGTMEINDQITVSELAKNKENMFTFSLKGVVTNSQSGKPKKTTFFLAAPKQEDVHNWITLILSVSHYSSSGPSFLKMKRLKLRSATRASDELRRRTSPMYISDAEQEIRMLSCSEGSLVDSLDFERSFKENSHSGDDDFRSVSSSERSLVWDLIGCSPNSVTIRAKNLILDQVKSVKTWKYYGILNGLKIHSHKYSNSFMCSSIMNSSPQSIVRLLKDCEFNRFWHSQLLDCHIIEEHDSNTHLVHLLFKAPFGHSSPRDFVVLREVCPFSNGSFLVMYTSVQASNAKLADYSDFRPIRGHIEHFGILVSPYKLAPNTAQVSWIVDIDWKVWWDDSSFVPMMALRYLQRNLTTEIFTDLISLRESIDHVSLNENESIANFFSIADSNNQLVREKRILSDSTIDDIDIRLPRSASVQKKSSKDETKDKGQDEDVDFDPKFELGIPDFSKAEGGGMMYTDVEEVQKQRWIAKDVIKSMGSNLVQGKSLISISMPVKIFEPRSFLQRMTDFWGLAPEYLGKAGMTADPVERMKLVVSFLISGLHRGVKQRKPFNPILGETFEASYRDGTEVFMEQIAHHPPVTAFLMIGPDKCFIFHGCNEYKANLSVNSAVGHQAGLNCIQFKDGSEITFHMPQTVIKGIVWGNRVIYWKNKLIFEDKTNHLQCEINFQADQASWFSSSQDALDGIEGKIINTITGNTVSTVSGSWIEEICFDGKSYWNLEAARPQKIRGKPNCLESDCRKRADLIKLASGDAVGSQESKTKLEELQRYDRKLRSAALLTRSLR